MNRGRFPKQKEVRESHQSLRAVIGMLSPTINQPAQPVLPVPFKIFEQQINAFL